MTQLGNMAEIIDHFPQALEKLISKYKDKPTLQAYIKSLVRQVQDLEDATWQVIRSRFLDEADDTRAALLGKLVGQARRGESLDIYKLYISVRILVNRSLARVQDILQIAEILLIDQFPEYSEGGANFLINAKEALNPATDPEVIVEMIKAAKGAGIGFLFTYPPSDNANIFGFADESPTLQPTEGWGSSTETAAGGRWKSAIDGRVTGYIT